MKLALIFILFLAALAVIACLVMAIQSQQTPTNIGLRDGLLQPCPDSPNCVCSEMHTSMSSEHAITAISGGMDGWKQAAHSIQRAGGSIQHQDDQYLRASFTSPVFRYVDDVELRYENNSGLIHVRSASRVGRSDFGVNRKRVEQIRTMMQAAQK